MGHINHRDAKAFVQVLDFKLHMLAQLLVQGPQGFVHQNQGRVKHQSPRQGDALLLAARKLCGTPVQEGPHLHHIQGTFHLGLALVTRHAAHF